MRERSTAYPALTASFSPRERAAGLLDQAIFGALLALIVLIAIPYGTVESWWEAVFECAVFALGALWMVEGLLSGEWFVKEHRLLVPPLVLAGFAFFQTIPLPTEAPRVAGLEVWNAISADPFETRLFALNLLALTLAAGLLLRYTSNGRRLRALIFTVIGVGAASALFGIVRQTAHRGAEGFILPALTAGSGYGQFVNRNHFAFLMEMALGLALGIVVGRGAARERGVIYLAMAMPVWTALILANSRGGIFAMLSQMFFLALLWMSRPPTDEAAAGHGVIPGRWRSFARSFAARAVLGVCLFAAIVIGVIWVGGDPLVTRLETVKEEVGPSAASDLSGARRAEMWKATWRVIKEHPIVGVGFGGYWVAIAGHHNASGELLPHEAHNDYLELLASGGFVGAAIGVWFVIMFIKRARLQFRSADPFRRATCLGALTGIFGIGIHSLVDFGLHVIVNALVFVALVVIATVNIRLEESAPRAFGTRRYRGGT